MRDLTQVCMGRSVHTCILKNVVIGMAHETNIGMFWQVFVDEGVQCVL